MYSFKKEGIQAGSEGPELDFDCDTEEVLETKLTAGLRGPAVYLTGRLEGS